jgi:hypothetical protein
MADISVLARLLNGATRNVDLTNNTPVVLSVKVGGGVSNTELTKTILDNLISHLTDTANPHSVTKTQVGLGNVDDVQQLPMSYLDTDNTLSANSDTKVPSQKAVKYYIDNTAGSASSALDGTFTINNTTTPSKKMNFDVAGVATATTRTVIMPDANVDLGGLTNNNIALTAAIGYAKLNLNLAIIDGDINAAAGILESKLALDFSTASLNTAIGGKVSKAGDSMSSAANLTFSGGGEVLGLPSTPSSSGSAASKAYVDAVALGLAPKKAVRVATLVPGTLATAFANGQTIDTITLATGDRILIKNQNTPSENGIYIVNASGAPTRATDMDSLSPIDEINGAWVPVQFGTQAGKIFVQYGVVNTLDTDAINFEFYNPIASLLGGDMVSVTGSTISLDLSTTGGLESSNPGDLSGQLQVKLDGSTLSKSSSGLKVAALGITNSEVSASAAIAESKLALDFSTSSLNTAIGTKVTANTAITGATKTKITYDAKGLVTAGTDATTADIADSTNKRYVTDSQLTVIGNTSGTNTGDQTITLTGDATGSGTGSFAVTVNNAPAIKASSEVAGEAFSASTIYAVRYGQNAETAGRLYKADLDATSTDNFYVIGIVKTSGALSAADPIPAITKFGLITLTSHGFTVGKPVYLSASGALTSTAPTTVNHAVVKLGIVKDANTIDIQIQTMGVN